MTTTQSEKGPWWKTEPHSAGPHSPGDAREGPYASRRAQAREDSDPTAQSQADSAAKSAVTDGDETAFDWSEWLAAQASAFTPPDVWSNDRPSLSKRWAYASRGEWTTKTGAPRRLGQAYAWYAGAISGLLLYLDWIVERPSRHAAAIVLVVLLAQFPPLSWLI